MPEQRSRVIYGDGRCEVVIDAAAVTFFDADTNSLVSLSRAAFREVVLGWERHLQREAEES